MVHEKLNFIEETFRIFTFHIFLTQGNNSCALESSSNTNLCHKIKHLRAYSLEHIYRSLKNIGHCLSNCRIRLSMPTSSSRGTNFRHRIERHSLSSHRRIVKNLDCGRLATSLHSWVRVNQTSNPYVRQNVIILKLVELDIRDSTYCTS
jgi:hypothetical protein